MSRAPDCHIFNPQSEVFNFRRCLLGRFPTPAHQLVSLERVLGLDSLWIKRDDQSGPLGGGNKVRKLEYLLADAQQKGYDTLFTVGPCGSNHVRATVVYGKAVGFRVDCLVFDQPPSEFSETNFQAICAQADSVQQVTHKTGFVVRYGLEYARRFIERKSSRYFVPPGGSSPLGCLGYINAAYELKTQIDAGLLPEPKLIFVALGTCSTMAGLVVGMKLAGVQGKVVGVRVVDRVVANGWSVVRLVRHTLKLVGTKQTITAREFAIWHRDFGRGYAIPTVESSRAVRMMQEHEDIRIENTYTGKTLAGLIHYVKAHQCEKLPILFWNTYGQAKEIEN